jgi:hypothetical protein
MGKQLDNVGHILDKDIDNLLNARQIAFEETKLKDKEKGFDIDDIESIRNFDLGFTPSGNTVLIKRISVEEKYGNIIIPDMSSTETKGVIVETGIYVGTVEKGDIVSLHTKGEGGQSINLSKVIHERILKGITFYECSYDLISGIFKNKQKVLQTIKDNIKKEKDERQ